MKKRIKKEFKSPNSLEEKKKISSATIIVRFRVEWNKEDIYLLL